MIKTLELVKEMVSLMYDLYDLDFNERRSINKILVLVNELIGYEESSTYSSNVVYNSL